MALLVESNDYIQQLRLLSTAGVTCITGLVVHFFIVGVSVVDWWKGRPLTTADLLITAIGASRIILLFSSLFDLVWNFWGYDSAAYPIAIGFILCPFTYCNIWLSVLLSIFYSLMISNFQNVLFLYLKKIISQRVLGLIIMFVLQSIGFSSVEVLDSFQDISKNVTQEDRHYTDEFIQFRVHMFYLGNALPFLFYVISSLALLGFLCHHMLRMKRDKTVTSHLDAYYKAIRFTIVSLFCFALYTSVNMFRMYYYTFLGVAGSAIVWNCLPMLHSIYLIYMTGRLRSHFTKHVHVITMCLLFIRGSESRSGVQIHIISQ